MPWALGGGVKCSGCFHAPAACNNRVKVCPVILTSFKSLMGRNGDTAPLPAPFPSLIIRAEWADLSGARRAGSEWWEDVFWFNGLYTTMGPPGLLASILLDGRQRVAPHFPPETLLGPHLFTQARSLGRGTHRDSLRSVPCSKHPGEAAHGPWGISPCLAPCSLPPPRLRLPCPRTRHQASSPRSCLLAARAARGGPRRQQRARREARLYFRARRGCLSLLRVVLARR